MSLHAIQRALTLQYVIWGYASFYCTEVDILDCCLDCIVLVLLVIKNLYFNYTLTYFCSLVVQLDPSLFLNQFFIDLNKQKKKLVIKFCDVGQKMDKRIK